MIYETAMTMSVGVTSDGQLTFNTYNAAGQAISAMTMNVAAARWLIARLTQAAHEASSQSAPPSSGPAAASATGAVESVKTEVG